MVIDLVHVCYGRGGDAATVLLVLPTATLNITCVLQGRELVLVIDASELTIHVVYTIDIIAACV